MSVEFVVAPFKEAQMVVEQATDGKWYTAACRTPRWHDVYRFPDPIWNAAQRPIGTFRRGLSLLLPEE